MGGREAGLRHRELVVTHTQSLTQTADTASTIEWAKLALSSPKARVLRVTRIRYDGADHPIALEEVVLALDRFPGLTANGGDIPDIIELGRRHGLSVGRASARVSIMAATKDVATHLGIATGTNVLKLDRVVETIDGEPVEWRVAFRKI
jgi:DNA-binding GntR family transcriptional regulator